MDEKSLCLLHELQNQNIISNLNVYYGDDNILSSAKLLCSVYKSLSLFQTQDKIYVCNKFINVIVFNAVNNNLTLEGYIKREYPTPLCVCNHINEDIVCLLKDAYSNNLQILLQVKGIDNNILSLNYAYIISFDCNVVWLNTANTIYLVLLKEVCSIIIKY